MGSTFTIEGEAPDGLPPLLGRFRTAYNAGNASDLAACFDEEASFVNIAAGVATGRAAIEDMHADAFAHLLKHTVIDFTEVTSRLLRNDVAMVQIVWTVTVQPVAEADKPHARTGILLMILRQGPGEQWSIAAAQNTQKPARAD